jgi:hypothetical protein
MGSSQPNQESRCPQCGATLAADADYCSTCRCEIVSAQVAEGSPFGPADAAGGPEWQPGQPQRPRASAGDVLRILCIVIVVLVAAAIAFFTTCLGGFFVSDAVMPGHGINWGMTVGFVAGGVAAVVVAFGVAWLFWRHAHRRRYPRR